MISVITIARNEEKTISDTLKSIQIQSFKDWECIIVDGNSTDKTIEISQNFIHIDDRFKLQRQTRNGISAAFNEGVLMAKGEYLIFLNAGDRFKESTALQKLMSLVKSTSEIKLIAFRSKYMTENGVELEEYIPLSIPSFEDLEWYCSIAHHSILIPKICFEKAGLYSESFQIAMDYELWLRFKKFGFSILAQSEAISLHRKGGISFTSIDKGRIEGLSARLLHLPLARKSLFKDFAKFVLLTIKSFRKIIL